MVVIVIELHLNCDPPQTVYFHDEIEGTGYRLRSINNEGKMVPANPA